MPSFFWYCWFFSLLSCISGILHTMLLMLFDVLMRGCSGWEPQAVCGQQRVLHQGNQLQYPNFYLTSGFPQTLLYPTPLGYLSITDDYGGGGYVCSAWWSLCSADIAQLSLPPGMNGNQLAMIATTLMLALPRLPDIQLHAFPLQPYFESNKWPPAPGNGFKALWERDFPLIQQLGANTLRIYPLLLLFHLFLLSFGTYNTNPTTRQFSQEYPNIVPLPLGKNHTAFMGVRYNLDCWF